MKLAPTLHALTLFGYIYVSLLLPVAVSIQRSSSSIHIDKRHSDKNGEVQITSTLESVHNIQNITDVTRNAKEVTYTASEKFLESLREKCKKYKSISLICSSLRLVLPITPTLPPPLMAPSDTTTNPEEADKKALLESMKLQERFTEPWNFTEIETHIISPEQYDETTSLPAGYHFDYYHNHKEVSAVTDKETEYDLLPRETYDDSGAYHMLYGNSYTEPNVFRNEDYSNNMTVGISGSNPFRQPYQSEKNDYSEIIEENMENETNSQEKGTTRNTTYQDQITDISEGNVVRTTDRTKQIGSLIFLEEPEFRTPYTDINPDYDDKEENEQGESFEIEEEDENNHVQGNKYKLECNDGANCSAGESSTQNWGDDTGKEEDDGKSEILDRFIDDSVKIFKNSLTIKFPTFERVANRIAEWFQSIFGMKTRDEARGRLKKTLNPFIIGLMVKTAIILASVIGLVMKFVVAKVVTLSLASIIFAAVALFKKFSAPQGGTVYVHTNGGASHKTGGSWDKEGYGTVYQPNRVTKDVSAYQAWENYIKKQGGEYSAPTGIGDRYYQYYNSYYRPNSAIYTTTMSPY